MIIRIKNGPKFDVECESLTVTLYFVRTEDGFKMVEEKPKEGEYGEFEVLFELEGIMGGPAVSFREVGGPLAGELMAAKRPRAPVSMDIELPIGIVTARDGIGDWWKAITLGSRKSAFVEDTRGS